MNKKAQMGEIQRIIIISIGGLLLLTFIGVVVYQHFFTQGEIEACRFSALAQATAKVATLPGGSPFNLECDRRFVDIQKDHAAMEYNNPLPTKSLEIISRGKRMKQYPKLTDDIVNGIIAEEMKTCWYQFGEGKTDVFQNKWFAGDTVCFICSEIHFNEKMRADTGAPTEYTGLIAYLKDVDYPSGPGSYFDYFAQAKSYDSWAEYIDTDQKNEKTYDPILIGNTYYVMFVRDSHFWNLETGTDKNSYLVLLVTIDQLNDKCSFVAG